MTSLKSLDTHLWVSIAKTFNQLKPASTATLLKRMDSNPNFLREILPLLGKALDRSLETSQFLLQPGLFKLKKDCVYPIFLSEYWACIYEKDGTLKQDFDVTLITELRTLCYLFYKQVVPFTKEQFDTACDAFIERDNQVKVDFSDIDLTDTRRIFQSLLPDDPFDIVCRHSNGATADKINNVEKRKFVRYIPSLHSVYDMPTYFFNSRSHLELAKCRNFTRCEPPAVFALVPKDSRGPRGICMEPHERMYVQKGLMHKIYDYIENYSPAKGYINFTDQTINQNLAKASSIDREYSTIDLKDASDLVSWELVRQLVDSSWLEALIATRSAKVTLPDGRVVSLKKYAPMGSALCFPIEAIVFYSIVRSVTDVCWVYGDDIIVPTQDFHLVCEELQRYGLIVNHDKSLSAGFFRESCGGDYYKGTNITPIRYRQGDFQSFVDFANLLSAKFSASTGEAAVLTYESIVGQPVPRLPHSNKDYSPIIGLYCDILYPSYLTPATRRRQHGIRYNMKLQRFEMRALTPKLHSSKVKPSIDDCTEYDHFYDVLTQGYPGNSPIEDEFLTSTQLYEINKLVPFERDITSKIKVTKSRLGYQWAAISGVI